MSAPTPVWRPDPDLVAGSAIGRFTTHLSRRHDLSFENYSQLWRWSVDHLEEFWAKVWDFFDVQAEGRPELVLADSAMPGARWFTGTRLNYAQHALRHGDQPSTKDTVAVTAIDKSGDTTTRVATSTCPGCSPWASPERHCPRRPISGSTTRSGHTSRSPRPAAAPTWSAGSPAAHPRPPSGPAKISAPLLGVALEAWDDAGQPVDGEVGELVVTQPMPSMPLYFWNDPDGRRYRDAYFSAYPGSGVTATGCAPPGTAR